MALKLAVVSTKGGSGKTTCAVNLAGLLADLGQRVLLIDADPQASASSYYPITHETPLGLAALITSGSPEGAISKTNISNLHLVIADEPTRAETTDMRRPNLRDWIGNDPFGRLKLREAIPALDDDYDFILIDTQGSAGPLLDSAILAADMLLSPITPEMLAAREFARGTVPTVMRLQRYAQLGAPIGNLRGVIYKQDRTIDARRIATELRGELFAPSGGKISIMETVVPSSVAYKEAATAQVPVHRLDAKRRGAGPSGAEVMLELMRELFPHLSDARLISAEIVDIRVGQGGNS